MALMIGCIWHGLDALRGTRAKPGNHLVHYIWVSDRELLAMYSFCCAEVQVNICA